MTQDWDADAYARDARYVSDLATEVVELLNPRPGERILDLGCGDGVLTRGLADAGCIVVGVDSSPQMVEAAVKLGVDARVMDGESLSFVEEFDAVFSNAALHWMTRPERVVAGVRRALKPGGRFVGEFGGHGNVAAVRRALSEALDERGLSADELNPWYFPTPEEYRALLEAEGMEVSECILFPRPTVVTTGIVNWLKVFAQRFMEPILEGEREAFLQQVAKYCEAELLNADGEWVVDYVRLRFAAKRR